MTSPGARVPPIPPNTRRMVICVPDNVEWLSLVTGCLAQLTFGWYYNKNSGDWEAARDRAKQMYFEWQDQNGLCDMIDCDEVADCVENSENVQNAINRLVQNQGFGNNQPGVPLPTSARVENLAAGTNPACDPDILWAEALGLVQFANRAITDWLETVETWTNRVELANALASLPMINVIGADALFSYINLLQEGLLENYNEDYTEVYEQQLACEIFCDARAGCILSIDGIYNILWARIQAQIGGLFDDPVDIFNMLNDITAVDINFIDVADLYHWFFWGALKLANWLLPVQSGYERIYQTISLFSDEPDNDWETLCTDCEWESVLDFTLDDYGFVTFGAWSSGTAGTWALGVGFTGTYSVSSGNGYNIIQQSIALDSCSIDSVEYEYTLTNGLQGAGAIPRIISTNAGNVGLDGSIPPDGIGVFVGNTPRSGVTELWFRAQSGFRPGSVVDPGGSIIVTKITVRGTGTKPSQLP